MSVRVYTRDEVYAELRAAGFSPTDIKTERNTVWKNAQGDAITVNHSHDTYPYYYLNDLLEAIGISYNFSGGVVDMRTYKVSH